VLLLFFLLFVTPLCVSAIAYQAEGIGANWRTADRSSAGLLPPAARNPGAVVRVFAARTVRWRGIFAVHCWIVVKPEGAARYTRYDYTAWGDPIRMNGFEPEWVNSPKRVVRPMDRKQKMKAHVRKSLTGPTNAGTTTLLKSACA